MHDWISENIRAKAYRVDELNLTFDLGKLEDFGPANIYGTAHAEGAEIQFHSGLPPVKADVVKIAYRNDRLSFDLEHPVYLDKNLVGSEVFIDKLTKHNPLLAVIIKTASRFDGAVLNILEGFGIRVPLRQEKGVTQAELNLLFTLPGFDLQTSGNFVTGPGHWIWRGVPFQAQGAKVLLDNNEVIIHEADISFGDTLKTTLFGTVNTASKQAALISEIKLLCLSAKGLPLLQAENLTMPLAIDFGHEPIAIDLDKIGTTIAVNGKTKVINIKDFLDAD